MSLSMLVRLYIKLVFLREEVTADIACILLFAGGTWILAHTPRRLSKKLGCNPIVSASQFLLYETGSPANGDDDIQPAPDVKRVQTSGPPSAQAIMLVLYVRLRANSCSDTDKFNLVIPLVGIDTCDNTASTQGDKTVVKNLARHLTNLLSDACSSSSCLKLASQSKADLTNGF